MGKENFEQIKNLSDVVEEIKESGVPSESEMRDRLGSIYEQQTKKQIQLKINQYTKMFEQFKAGKLDSKGIEKMITLQAELDSYLKAQ